MKTHNTLAPTPQTEALIMKYRSPAADSAEGWENESLAERLSAHEFQDRNIDFDAHEIVTYKVTACRPDGSGESDGPVYTINHATQLDIERHRHRVRQLNL